MQPGDDKWPESIQALYEQVTGASPDAVLSSRPRWSEQLAEWVRSATLDEREMAQTAAWSRLDSGDRSPGELLFLLAHSGELLWPYTAPPRELLHRLISRREQLVLALNAQGQAETVGPLMEQMGAEVSKVLTRYLKRHPEALRELVSGVRCTFDGRVLRFHDTVELDLKFLLGSEKRVIGRLDQLRALLPHLREGRDKLVAFIRERAARIPWRECRDVLEEKLFQMVASPEGRSELRGFLGSYASGKSEARWCTRASLLLTRNLEEGGALAVIENLSDLLVYFEAPVEGLRGALQALVASIHEDKELERHRVVADKCWEHLKPKAEPGLALVLLWLEERIFRVALRQGSEDAFERRNQARERVRELPVAEALYWLAEECADLWPRVESERRPGADELAAWRQEVTRRFAKKPVLRKAAIEFFLWCAPDAAASEAELVTLSLVKTGTDRRQLRRLGEHPSTRVRFRVRAINAWLVHGAESAPEPATPATLTGALRHLRAAGAMTLGGGRTWLKDRDLEELLLGAFSRVERDFSARYPEHFREDEARLVTRLLEDLRHEFESIRSDLSILLSQGQPVPLELDLQYRRTREPAPETARPAGVELAFVLKVEVDSFLTTKRAVLVLARKLEHRGEWAPNLRLGREQVDGLLGQTEASFCLFLVPPSLRAECWMVPARLVRGLMEAQGSLSTVSREGAQRVAHSLAQWMTYDLLGLWTGDDRPALLARTEPGAERSPDFIVEISVRKRGQ
ncbi:hypothetical protein ATI61_105385 [Archangium gephyra]|uniref:Uncharacterized protein n=1 Tax=Archangium gephyra TaxID=48 RepID=A0AAC8QF75_9BACT|nr:hypothetical protein [Archangium gephyra]AKJ06633.1 Hypothetical protein AA314_08259 [Archangium gephyra]REG32058.1 hypothetical protein ATI61_105385 [Archangium gephyra]